MVALIATTIKYLMWYQLFFSIIVFNPHNKLS